MKLAALPSALALVLALAACSHRKDDGEGKKKQPAGSQPRAPEQPAGQSLMVDGTPFVVTSCSPGRKHGFLGFDLKSYDKRRLWISAAPPGQGRVHVFRTPVLPVELGRCATVEVEELPDPVGGVTGRFDADCSAVGHTVRGAMTVTDCH